MPTSWLADQEPSTAWAGYSWPAFVGSAAEHDVAIVPVFGLADHGLGLPLDAEEVLGSVLLRAAVGSAPGNNAIRVLPPLRWVLGPYPHCAFGLDPDHAHAQVLELARGVAAAGFKRILFFNTSPWNVEFVDATSRDIRHELGLLSFVISAGGIGFDFHPASSQRGTTAAVVGRLLRTTHQPGAKAGKVIDATFRPGQFHQPEPLATWPTVDADGLLVQAAERLAVLIGEVRGYIPPVSQERSGAQAPLQTTVAPLPCPRAIPFPAGYRARYLGSLGGNEIDQLPGKENAWVILPTAAVEQHGPHLPVGVDAILGQGFLTEALKEGAGERALWVAPPITFGKSNEHESFPGTLSVSGKTFRHVFRAAVAQLHRWGFRKVAVLNTHGGNSAVLTYSIRELQVELGIRIGVLNHLFRPSLSPQESANGFHAGEYETSLMLALAPEWVDMAKAVSEYPAQVDAPGSLRPENAPAIFSWLTANISRSGVMGDATAATAEKGAYWLREYSVSIVRRLEELG